MSNRAAWAFLAAIGQAKEDPRSVLRSVDHRASRISLRLTALRILCKIRLLALESEVVNSK